MFSYIFSNSNALRAFFYIPLLSSATGLAAANAVTDTIDSKKSLQEVQVKGHFKQGLRSALPAQTLNASQIANLNASNVADVAKHFAGVTVKDYGGIGGLKTVSVRGLGASYTGISYDGLMMSDIQTGQIDLSQFCLENIESVTIHNGQPINLLQSAKMFASASVLSIQTKSPIYDFNHSLSGQAGIKSGSWGLINPSLQLDKYLNEKLLVALTLNGTKANGEYPFKFNINPYGKNIIESTRYNSDVKNLKSELNISYKFTNREILNVKTNYYYSDRGLPSAVTAYNFKDARGRMNDKNILSQFYFENKKSDQWQYLLSGKFSRQYMKYTDKSNNYSTLENQTLVETYLQNEYYLSAAIQYRPLDHLTIAATTDYWFNNLFSTSNLNNEDHAPGRHSSLSNLSAKFQQDRLTLGGNILFLYAQGNADTTKVVSHYHKASPTLFGSYQLLDDKNLTFRVFYKEIYRLATFSEMYYQSLSFKPLKPEDSKQLNVGITYQTPNALFLDHLNLSVDGYYNDITDKIVITYSVPYPTTSNIGKVKVKGLDVNMNALKEINSKNRLELTANYSYQMAQNYEDKPETWGDILSYTPIHSGSTSLSYTYRKLVCGYNMVFAGKRYSGQNSYKLNYLAPYVDQSIFGRYTYKQWSLMAEIINLFDNNYEIVKNYPMPGRHFKISINYKF